MVFMEERVMVAEKIKIHHGDTKTLRGKFWN